MFEVSQEQVSLSCKVSSGQSWSLWVASALPISVFSSVPESMEPVPLVNEGHRLCKRWRRSDWNQANCNYMGGQVPHLWQHCHITACNDWAYRDPSFHFCPLEFSRESLEFTVCVMVLCSHETQQCNNINSASFSFFFPFLLSHTLTEASCSNISEEQTQVINMEDLPTWTSSSNDLLCGLDLLLFFLSPSPRTKT